MSGSGQLNTVSVWFWPNWIRLSVFRQSSALVIWPKHIIWPKEQVLAKSNCFSHLYLSKFACENRNFWPKQSTSARIIGQIFGFGSAFEIRLFQLSVFRQKICFGWPLISGAQLRCPDCSALSTHSERVWPRSTPRGHHSQWNCRRQSSRSYQGGTPTGQRSPCSTRTDTIHLLWNTRPLYKALSTNSMLLWNRWLSGIFYSFPSWQQLHTNFS